jgi:hypothetical protein
MNLSDAVPAKDPQQLNKVGSEQGILSSPTRAAKYSFVGVRCKSCLGEGRTTWLLLKYLGPEEGKPPYQLILPPAPRMATFHMHCESCDVNDTYSRNEAKIVSLEQAPPPDFVNQY